MLKKRLRSVVLKAVFEAQNLMQSKDVRTGFQIGIIGATLIGINSIAGAALPWEQPLNNIANSMSGPTAKLVGAMAIVATGLGMAIGEHGAVMQRLLKIVMGLSIAFFTTSIISDLWSERETEVNRNE